MRLFIAFFLLFTTVTNSVQAQSQSIYNLKIDSIAGNAKIDFQSFKGKRILIVNTASSDSNFKQQYNELIQLYQIYNQKLVVIAVPSNSFNSEVGTTQQVSARYSQFGKHKFPVTIRLSVTNTQIHPLYKWLTRKVDNGVADSEIRRPFYKFLIDTDGRLIASFNEKVTPMSDIIQTLVNR